MALSPVLLVEDDPAIADAVVFALRREGLTVEHQAWIAQARQALRRERFELLILDIGLPDGSGLDFCRELRGQADMRSLPILMLSARSEELDLVLGLELGADDYVAKPFSPRELVARVRALLRRAQAAPPPALRIEGQRAWWQGQALALTRLELHLLQSLLAASGRILSREHLLDAVWGVEAPSGDRTVDTHIKTLRAKLREVGADPITTHRGLGYSLKA